ncbi:MAG TPA: hypothetical protein VFX45_10530 [Solirubrobacterales bacterium]|nr:hypothetical protein [Solirubrobacterales bacterium]
MAVMAREAWTDERLDDMKAGMDAGFADMRTEFRAIRGEMAASRQAMLQVAAAIWVTTLVGFLGVIATIFTKL